MWFSFCTKWIGSNVSKIILNERNLTRAKSPLHSGELKIKHWFMTLNEILFVSCNLHVLWKMSIFVIELKNNRTPFETIFGLGPLFLGVNFYKNIKFSNKTWFIGANSINRQSMSKTQKSYLVYVNITIRCKYPVQTSEGFSLVMGEERTRPNIL